MTTNIFETIDTSNNKSKQSNRLLDKNEKCVD